MKNAVKSLMNSPCVLDLSSSACNHSKDSTSTVRRKGFASGLTTISYRYFFSLLNCIGILLLLMWCIWWIQNFLACRMTHGQYLLIPVWNFLGLDFMHNDLAVRAWMQGHDPYREAFGDFRGLYSYPPPALLLYTWCALLPSVVATTLWSCAVAIIVTLGTWYSRFSSEQSIRPQIPFWFALASILWSLPVLFAMERGNGDALVLGLLLLAAGVFRFSSSFFRDSAIGSLLGLAAWIKIYPALLFLGLFTLREYRALAWSVIASILIGLVTLPGTLEWLDRVKNHNAQMGRERVIYDAIAWLLGQDRGDEYRNATQYNVIWAPVSPCCHSLSLYWPKLCSQLRLHTLSRFPGLLGAGGLLVPLGLFVSYSLFRARAVSARWGFCYLIWLASLATFWMPVSFDYNLIYLPIAVYAVWSSKDHFLLQGCLLLYSLSWQPFAWGLFLHPRAASFLFFAKLIGLFSVGFALIQRVNEPKPDLVAEFVHGSGDHVFIASEN